MLKIFACLAFFLVSQISSAQVDPFGKNPNAERREVAVFDKISIQGGIDLVLAADTREEVWVSGRDTEVRDRIVTRVNNGTLEIFYDARTGLNWPVNMKLKVHVSYRKLASLAASGSCDVVAEGTIRAESFSLSLNGSSDFKGAFDVRSLEIRQSGSADSQIAGSAKKAKITLSGASDLKAYGLVIDNAIVRVSGASDAQITVNGEMEVRASGASDVLYKGTGSVHTVESSGASSVKKVD